MKIRHFAVPEQTLQEVLNYLTKRPHGEVNELFNLIQNTSQELTSLKVEEKPPTNESSTPNV